jgi:hypothetical protein
VPVFRVVADVCWRLAGSAVAVVAMDAGEPEVATGSVVLPVTGRVLRVNFNLVCTEPAGLGRASAGRRSVLLLWGSMLGRGRWPTAVMLAVVLLLR